MKNIIGFYTVSYQPNILCGWLSGNAARKMELASDDEFRSSVERVLNMFSKRQINHEVKTIIRLMSNLIKYLVQQKINARFLQGEKGGSLFRK